jgi:hypothetical protein
LLCGKRGEHSLESQDFTIEFPILRLRLSLGFGIPVASGRGVGLDLGSMLFPGSLPPEKKIGR